MKAPQINMNSKAPKTKQQLAEEEWLDTERKLKEIEDSMYKLNSPSIRQTSRRDRAHSTHITDPFGILGKDPVRGASVADRLKAKLQVGKSSSRRV